MANVQELRSFVHWGTFAPAVDRALSAAGWQRIEVDTLDQVPQALKQYRSHVIMFDMVTSQAAALRKIEQLIVALPDVEWLAQVNEQTLQDSRVRELIYANCYDFCMQPVDLQRLQVCLGHAWGMARLGVHKAGAEQQAELGLDGLIGTSKALHDLQTQIRKLAAVTVPVLVTGESGTGKEVVARNLHRLSLRSKGSFIAINCGALPEHLVQAELFGNERGAFTGANARKIGKIEAAQGGTVFLDEIGDLPLDAQANLLRFLQEGTIERIGGHESLRMDVRVIAATHVDLEKAVKEDRFRSDLYYRLNVLRLRMPPLRERDGDVEILARYFLNRFANEHGVRARGFSSNALDAMAAHSWPGNIRELMNRVRRAAVLCETGSITGEDLELTSNNEAASSLEDVREEAERELIQQTLRESRFNMSECSRRLGVSRVTLYRLCKKLKVSANSAA